MALVKLLPLRLWLELRPEKFGKSKWNGMESHGGLKAKGKAKKKKQKHKAWRATSKLRPAGKHKHKQMSSLHLSKQTSKCSQRRGLAKAYAEAKARPNRRDIQSKARNKQNPAINSLETAHTKKRRVTGASKRQHGARTTKNKEQEHPQTKTNVKMTTKTKARKHRHPSKNIKAQAQVRRLLPRFKHLKSQKQKANSNTGAGAMSRSHHSSMLVRAAGASRALVRNKEKQQQKNNIKAKKQKQCPSWSYQESRTPLCPRWLRCTDGACEVATASALA